MLAAMLGTEAGNLPPTLLQHANRQLRLVPSLLRQFRRFFSIFSLFLRLQFCLGQYPWSWLSLAWWLGSLQPWTAYKHVGSDPVPQVVG